MIKVEIWRNGYYPCGYQLKAVRDDITQKILARAKENGYPNNEEIAVTSSDDMEYILSPKQWKELEEWGSITVLMDAWEFAHCYGYNAHTVFE